MRGLMMERPLLISDLPEHAAAVHGDREIVSGTADYDQVDRSLAIPLGAGLYPQSSADRNPWRACDEISHPRIVPVTEMRQARSMQ